ncbi:MAG: hypothetical protein MZU95_04060 [Desulfomicrobium escambiense]|nr:hypothetical protein [Desulfomicrobium escambiense]
MKAKNSKIIHLSGDNAINSSQLIAKVTSLCAKHKVSVDDIKMMNLEHKAFYAMISGKSFPDKTLSFWDELFKIAEELNVKARLDKMEEA